MWAPVDAAAPLTPQWPVRLLALGLTVHLVSAQTTTPPPPPTVWPQDWSNLELWRGLPALAQLVADGGALRQADLSVRLAVLPGHEAPAADAHLTIQHISECKCRVECQADPGCAGFTYILTNGTETCRLFEKRRDLSIDVDQPNPDALTEFKILSAAPGDPCFLDVECSRRTEDSACDRTGTEPGICVCAAGLVQHGHACVDPMSLTTTTPTTTTTTVTTTTTETTSEPPTTTTTSTEATTTVTTTTTTTPAPVVSGDVVLANLLSEAEWPCDGDDQYCNFMTSLAEGGAAYPTFWAASMDAGVCGANSRCTFPAQLVDDSGVRRIEAWRGVGQFTFQMADDFSSPPADLSGYVPGSANGNEPWKYDCTSAPGDAHTLLTGILGIYRTDHFNKNIPQDIDEMLCTRFADVHLEVDPTGGQPLDITNNGAWECQPGMVVTGLYDDEAHFLQAKRAKCAPLTRGTVSATDCVMAAKHAASNSAIYWNACPQGPSLRVVTGLTLETVPSDQLSKMWTLKCCAVTGASTSLTVV